jgi:hypothetical protein
MSPSPDAEELHIAREGLERIYRDGCHAADERKHTSGEQASLSALHRGWLLRARGRSPYLD